MANDIDVYNVARYLVKEYGDSAINQIRKKIEHYTSIGDGASVRTWYEVEDAANDIISTSEYAKEFVEG